MGAQMLDRVQRDNEKFLYQKLLPAPAQFRPHIIKRYRDITKQAGHVAANIDLLDVSDVMTAQGVDIKKAADNDAICIEAKKRARECAGIISAQDVAKAYEYAQEVGLYLTEQQESKLTSAGLGARLSDEHFWRRALRKHYGRATERAAISINIVNRKADIYASTASVERRHQQKSRNRQLLETMQAVNELGDAFTLQELADKTVSNPKIRRCELMTRIAGMEQHAKNIDYVGEFYTITCPSRFHSALSKSGERNPRFDGSSPRQANAYLSRLWARCRSAIKRARVNYFGFRVCEPQHDGTPHWHTLFFVHPEMQEKLRAIVKKYSLEESPDEKGAQKHRFTAVAIDWKRGSAAGYIAKYIAKNIDGFGIDQDLFGNDPIKSAARVDAWASTWGIRQFQQIGGPSVTTWRELRRIKPEDATPEILDHVSAADSANFCRFIELQNTLPVMLQKLPALNTETGEIRLNKYNEPAAPKIIGVCLLFSNVINLTRRHVWQVGRKKPGTAGPWSSVNNCTGVLNERHIGRGRQWPDDENSGTGCSSKRSIGFANDEKSRCTASNHSTTDRHFEGHGVLHVDAGGKL